jgi:protein transport protein SEC23
MLTGFHSSLEFKSKMWICPFCFQRNHFPQHYHEISEQQLPAELVPQYTTIEYALPRHPGSPPVFIYVVDTCLDESELVAMKEELLLSLSWLPEHALVGLVTFGTHVQVHELGYSECAKSCVFRGSRDITAEQVCPCRLGGGNPGSRVWSLCSCASTLALAHACRSRAVHRRPRRHRPRPAGSWSALLCVRCVCADCGRVQLPSEKCEFALQTILDELTPDPWPVAGENRPARCTGAAAAAAIALAEAVRLSLVFTLWSTRR